jgi:hypothetical protein
MALLYSLRRFLVLPIIGLAIFICGCASQQTQATTQVGENKLTRQDLQESGIAFITSSSVTGQEEDKPAMAMAFAEVMKNARPGLRIIPQADTLSAINKAGLANEYKRMLEDHGITGIFGRETLRKVADVTGVRYVAQLKLSGFRQESKSRWSALGVRITDTHITVLRLFLQIWDSNDGSIVWEGAHELTSAHDTTSEGTVTFKSSIEEAAQYLVMRLP